MSFDVRYANDFQILSVNIAETGKYRIESAFEAGSTVTVCDVDFDVLYSGPQYVAGKSSFEANLQAGNTYYIVIHGRIKLALLFDETCCLFNQFFRRGSFINRFR